MRTMFVKREEGLSVRACLPRCIKEFISDIVHTIFFTVAARNRAFSRRVTFKHLVSTCHIQTFGFSDISNIMVSLAKDHKF